MIRKLIPKSKFANNIILLSAGSLAGQVISFVFTIFITRAYLPSDFGFFSVYISFFSAIFVLANGKYDLAIVASQTLQESISLVKLCFFITLIVSSILLIVLFFFKFIIVRFIDKPELYNYFYFLPFSFFFASSVQVFWMWNVREKKFKDLSIVRILESTSNGTFSLALNMLSATGLFIGNIVSQVVSSSYLAIKVIRQHQIKIFSFNKKEMVSHALKYVDYPRYSIFQSFSDMFLLNGIVLIGSYFFKMEVLGYYALCMRVLQIPMSLIVKPISNVFFSEASELYREGGSFYQLTKKTIMMTAMFAVFIPVMMFLFGPFIFSFVFGVKWNEAGVYAQIFGVMIFFDLVRSPISQIPIITGKQKQVFRLSILSSIILAFVIFFSSMYLKESPREAFAIISLYLSVQTLFFIFLYLDFSKKNNSTHILRKK